MKQLRPASIRRGGAEPRRIPSYIWYLTDSRPALSGERQVRPARAACRSVACTACISASALQVGVGGMRLTSFHPRRGVRRAVGGCVGVLVGTRLQGGGRPGSRVWRLPARLLPSGSGPRGVSSPFGDLCSEQDLPGSMDDTPLPRGTGVIRTHPHLGAGEAQVPAPIRKELVHRNFWEAAFMQKNSLVL